MATHAIKSSPPPSPPHQTPWPPAEKSAPVVQPNGEPPQHADLQMLDIFHPWETSSLVNRMERLPAESAHSLYTWLRAAKHVGFESILIAELQALRHSDPLAFARLDAETKRCGFRQFDRIADLATLTRMVSDRHLAQDDPRPVMLVINAAHDSNHAFKRTSVVQQGWDEGFRVVVIESDNDEMSEALASSVRHDQIAAVIVNAHNNGRDAQLGASRTQHNWLQPKDPFWRAVQPYLAEEASVIFNGCHGGSLIAQETSQQLAEKHVTVSGPTGLIRPRYTQLLVHGGRVVGAEFHSDQRLSTASFRAGENVRALRPTIGISSLSIGAIIGASAITVTFGITAALSVLAWAWLLLPALLGGLLFAIGEIQRWSKPVKLVPLTNQNLTPDI